MPLDPGGGHPGAVVRCGDAEHAQRAAIDVFLDAGDGLACGSAEVSLQQPAKRVVVEQASPARTDAPPAEDQAQAPAQEVAQEIAAVGAKDLVRIQARPDAGEVLDRLGEAARMRGQVHGIEGAGGYAGQDGRVEILELAADVVQHADLVGGAGPAAGHRKAKLRAGGI